MPGQTGREVDVVIPVYRPDHRLRVNLERLLRQTLQPARILLVNTEESLFDPSLIEGLDRVEVIHIRKEEFDHGGTRHMAAEMLQGGLLLFMTQDAVPADRELVRRLADCFDDPQVGAAYARQLPREDCRTLERLIREFNYPAADAVHTAADVPRIGIKAYFCSDVCAMYRRESYERLGGFCRKMIFNEDMLFAAALIGDGMAVRYCAGARVIHSHNYSLAQQFHRNFDLAVSQAEHPEVFAQVPSEKEGVRMLRTICAKLLHKGRPDLMVVLAAQSAAKYAGYFLGKRYRSLPLCVVRACTTNPGYFAHMQEEMRRRG